jgi:cell division protein FtsB
MILRIAVVGLLGLAAYYAVFGGEYSVFDLHRIRAETAEASMALELRKAELEARSQWAEAIERDPRVLEALARERFGMLRSGEILYRFADGGNSAGGG